MRSNFSNLVNNSLQQRQSVDQHTTPAQGRMERRFAALRHSSARIASDLTSNLHARGQASPERSRSVNNIAGESTLPRVRSAQELPLTTVAQVLLRNQHQTLMVDVDLVNNNRLSDLDSIRFSPGASAA